MAQRIAERMAQHSQRDPGLDAVSEQGVDEPVVKFHALLHKASPSGIITQCLVIKQLALE